MQPPNRILERKILFAGQQVFAEGEEGDRAYLIQEGEVVISKGSTVLAVLGKGELFGEMALVDNQPRMATAKARTDVSVVIITREEFREKLARSDPFIRGLLNIFVRNIRKLTP